MDVVKYFHTIRYLTSVQLFFQLYYKVRAYARRSMGIKPEFKKYKEGAKLNVETPWIPKNVSYKGNNTFEFINVEHQFSGSWDSSKYSSLWRYNLNYMDFLLQPSMTFDEGSEWINCYIDSMRNNHIATDPYPISLRGINWIKFVSKHYESFSKKQLKRIDTALYSQYLILLHSTEKHLMANHYLENGFSLLFAAMYFNDKSFFKVADKIIRTQLEEQILSDGAHFELSPMYHCVILERLLDCYNIIKPVRNYKLNKFILQKIRLMLGWLQTIVLQDGNIPLFNDAAFEISPLPKEIFAYARSLDIEWEPVCLGECGYRKWNSGDCEVVVDIAALGPSYNLGHSHADTFNFIMNVNGNAFIVDSGTSTYTAGERRDYERSTEAHNTVTVANKNSSQVWGAFRCAKRAFVTLLEDTAYRVKASHDGYSSLGVNCVREYKFVNNLLKIVDILESDCDVDAVARFHLAPDVNVFSVDKEKVVTSLGTFCFNGALSIVVEPVDVAFSYNILQKTRRISVSFRNKLTTSVLPIK